ncbi:MAG TPA: type II toxin-antitoxin system VapC family toxin [Acidobacteriaceae bacterium]|nr:type II toxin-antitoxin system VapC family toxin [Acidobacteriaceae bacterium]
MSGSVLFDTCILIDYLRGLVQARAECDRHADRAISIVTWMEVLAGATAANEADTRTLLLYFQLLPLTLEVAERAVAIRRKNKIKLPDAIIKATAEMDGRVLITRNTRDFPAHARGIHVPYRV